MTANRSSKLPVSTMVFSNQRVTFVVWWIMRSKFGDRCSLSFLVQTEPTISDDPMATPWRSTLRHETAPAECTDHRLSLLPKGFDIFTTCRLHLVRFFHGFTYFRCYRCQRPVHSILYCLQCIVLLSSSLGGSGISKHWISNSSNSVGLQKLL